jgi:hypothetical protein
MTKATDRHWEYLILTVFTLQQWLREWASLLRYVLLCTHCFKTRPRARRDSDGQSPASHYGDWGSMPGQSMWYFCVWQSGTGITVSQITTILISQRLTSFFMCIIFLSERQKGDAGNLKKKNFLRKSGSVRYKGNFNLTLYVSINISTVWLVKFSFLQLALL